MQFASLPYPNVMMISELTNQINAFRDARDWKQFHNPKDMAISISIEAAELLEHFQWKNPAECETHLNANREAVADEMADVAIYLFELADLLGLDLARLTEFTTAITATSMTAMGISGIPIYLP